MQLNQIHTLNWNDLQPHAFLNTQLPKEHIENMFRILSKINDQNHIFLATSGSSSLNQKYKLVALHKNAFLNSSQAVNDLFQIATQDVLLNVLPTFHVGGLSLFSRAFCSGACIINIWDENFKWSPSHFVNICKDNKITVTSLVPTQIFDLVNGGYQSPQTLRCIFIGGGSLSTNLFLKAQKLGWNLYPTYGMTECCSQVATFSPNDHCNLNREACQQNLQSCSFELGVLPHLMVSIDENSCIRVSGNSLLSYYVHINEDDFTLEDPKINQTFITQDIGKLNPNNTLNVFGRIDDNIKINGEFVNLIHVNHEFQKCKDDLNLNLESAVISTPHARSGLHLIAVFLKSDILKQSAISALQLRYNRQVMTHERIHTIVFVDEIPKTDLGKIKTNLLKKNVAEKLASESKS